MGLLRAVISAALPEVAQQKVVVRELIGFKTSRLMSKITKLRLAGPQAEGIHDMWDEAC